jgi:long-chain acyl-CoA synthetase
VTADRPWLKFYGDLPPDVELPDHTLYEALAHAAGQWGGQTAVTYMGKDITFAELLADVDQAAAALARHGIGRGQTVALILPNIPNVIVLFYALNKVGARAALAHPLSSPAELAHYITETGAVWAVTVDLFYGRVRSAMSQTAAAKLLVTRVTDYLPPLKALGFRLGRGRKIPRLPADDAVVTWPDFMAAGAGAPAGPYRRPIEPDDGAVVLFSGGTTDLPKGIELTSQNFNALTAGLAPFVRFEPGRSLLAILPVFHGFGLGLCLHALLSCGGHALFVPEFSPAVYIANLRHHKPNYIAGVPTLFEAMMRQPDFAKVDFSNLLGVYCGADSLTPDLKHRFDRVLQAQGGTTELVEGYGLTECVTCCVVSPPGHYREHSMGVPIPGTLVKIADPETGATLPYGAEGEICIAGPQLMKGYVNDPEATAQTLRRHDDGLIWLHSGDIGTMDEDGYLYFLGRLKRLIKVSGVSVYPAQVEQVLEAHPKVARACAVGQPDDYQMTAVKAFVVPEPEARGTLDADELKEYCAKYLMKWAIPRFIEFRDELPTTLVGKVDYKALEQSAA